jgi:hypothetical protein
MVVSEPFGVFLIVWSIGIALSFVVTHGLKQEGPEVRERMPTLRHFEGARASWHFNRFIWTSAPAVVRTPWLRLAIYALRGWYLLSVAVMIWLVIDSFSQPPEGN